MTSEQGRSHRLRADDVALAFGLSLPLLSDGPLARGLQGEVWRLDAAEGAFAVKVSTVAVDEGELGVAARFQERAIAAGIPAPRPRRTTEGRLLASVGGLEVRLQEWVDVLAPEALLDPTAVGALLARLHLLGAPHAGPVGPWYTVPVRRWHELAEREPRLRPHVRDLVELESWLVPPEQLRVCHRDLWADNLRQTTTGLCLLDWDNAGPADPAHEMGQVLWEFGRTSADRARRLLEAYAEAGGPARVAGRSAFTALVAVLGHLVERAVEEQDEAALREFLDDPHTPEQLDRLLSWVS